ncbi:hypothetical protein BM1_08499 [Bipolaris maydis]|uniref:uncharacterized protein n=1 Tax=Cochliobolus heterostrophus TaxID=5016 RepID=UPI0024D7C2C7|nr:hypothetical protein BM1_08499 [Bipolaris maydis]KAJ5024845.1 hypothetical protein J3E73DRAFT_371598 [Bipolaris maydis]KAJ6266155.1 hypothetical protein PSV08DRAFT_366078 [Bipolaris maydis]KAJ6281169.1 hypothetical protein J3E71DRAFT_353739 [Bipolaris maydis]
MSIETKAAFRLSQLSRQLLLAIFDVVRFAHCCLADSLSFVPWCVPNWAELDWVELERVELDWVHLSVFQAVSGLSRLDLR